jgi:hypothetical protein
MLKNMEAATAIMERDPIKAMNITGLELKIPINIPAARAMDAMTIIFSRMLFLILLTN